MDQDLIELFLGALLGLFRTQELGEKVVNILELGFKLSQIEVTEFVHHALHCLILFQENVAWEEVLGSSVKISN